MIIAFGSVKLPSHVPMSVAIGVRCSAPACERAVLLPCARAVRQSDVDPLRATHESRPGDHRFRLF